MKDKETIKLFVPAKYPDHPLNLHELEVITEKQYRYCSRGRHALYHALKSLGISGNVAMPCYACPTIRDAIIAAGAKPVFCDIDSDDLNMSFDSFVQFCSQIEISCVIIPSLYGNPADLLRFEAYCSEKGIYIIDDAAQSFGAKLDNKYLSSYGNAGVIAFSPGKATPAPMGALLWTEKEYSWRRTNHAIVHRLIYKNYEINREGAYLSIPLIFRKLLSEIAIRVEQVISIRNDNPAKWELDKIGGAIKAALHGGFDFREKYYRAFMNEFGENKFFRVLKSQRGEPVYPKIVIIFDNEVIKKRFADGLRERRIATFGGYKLLGEGNRIPNAIRIASGVLELPIENDEKKMRYLFSCVRDMIAELEEESVIKEA